MGTQNFRSSPNNCKSQISRLRNMSWKSLQLLLKSERKIPKSRRVSWGKRQRNCNSWPKISSSMSCIRSSILPQSPKRNSKNHCMTTSRLFLNMRLKSLLWRRKSNWRTTELHNWLQLFRNKLSLRKPPPKSSSPRRKNSPKQSSNCMKSSQNCKSHRTSSHNWTNNWQ